MQFQVFLLPRAWGTFYETQGQCFLILTLAVRRAVRVLTRFLSPVGKNILNLENFAVTLS